MFFYFDKSSLVAIIGDIKRSKTIEQRNEVQIRLKEILEKINDKYVDDIASKFLVTLGDEFQGVLINNKNTLKIIQEIKMELFPIEVRFGIGIGRITTDIDTEMALGADGPGYYNARAAIYELKENEKKKQKVLSDVRIVTENGNTNAQLLINTIFELLKALEQTWTTRQREIIWDMLKYQDGQIKAAERLGITQSSVQKSLTNGKYYTYKKTIDNLEFVLGEMEL